MRQRLNAKKYDEWIERAKQENDYAFFHRLFKALKALKASPDGVVQLKPTLSGAVIIIDESLRKDGFRPTPLMIRDRLEEELGQDLSVSLEQVANEVQEKLDKLSERAQAGEAGQLLAEEASALPEASQYVSEALSSLVML